MIKPTTTKDNLQTDLNSILTAVKGKINPETAQEIQRAMNELLKQKNKYNREVLVNTVDKLLIIGDSKELNKEEIKQYKQFLVSFTEFLGTGLNKVYDFRNYLDLEQRKINRKIKDIEEKQHLRLG
jgi:hypothetical protein